MHDIKFTEPHIIQQSFNDIIHRRAENNPNQTAFTFLPEQGEGRIDLTYHKLDNEAAAIAAVLKKNKLKNECAVLLFPTGKDFVVSLLGCFYAGVIAVPAYPPDFFRLNSSLYRLKTILDDSKAKTVLTTSQIFNSLKVILEGSSQKISAGIASEKNLLEHKKIVKHILESLTWIITDSLEKEISDKWIDPDINGETIAFLQYSSGSTGIPKGIIITHKNLIVNSIMKEEAFEVNQDWECVSWLPVYHDMGLVGGIFQPLYSGFKCTLMPPSSFLSTPSKWLKVISEIKDKPIVSGGPNFAYDLCCRRVSNGQASKLDLNNWVVAFNGAEPVREKTIENFYSRFKDSGFRKESFYPCYGLAEATLFVSGGTKSAAPHTIILNKTALMENKVVESNNGDYNITLVSCGFSKGDGVIKIVNPETNKLCSSDEIGEIWFSSGSAAKGYWNKTEESNETFYALIKGVKEQPYLRTGDLGFIKDNQLYITGRLKDLIIIRGKNHYPQDIEFTIENCHPGIRSNCVAAFSIDSETEEKLITAVEISLSKEQNQEEIINKIRDAVSREHDLFISNVILLKPKTLLKTSSGKIQRWEVKNAYLNGSLEILRESLQVSSREEEMNNSSDNKFVTAVQVSKNLNKEEYQKMVDWLVNYIGKVLNIIPSQVDIFKTFSSFGIDSLMAVEFSSELEKETGKKISPTIVWEYSNIDKLARSLAEINSAYTKSIPVIVNKNEYIAVIGMACRFPGANNPDEFWELLRNGVDVIEEIPQERWNVDDFYNTDPETPGKISTRWGGFLKGIDKFDPGFFGISPREAVQMDPQQRLLLEVFWESLENSGIVPGKLAGTKTGVFIGISNHDYSQYQYGDYENIDVYGGIGNSFSIAANRISYLFDLKGPSIPIDTACSSSLVAAHLACRSLLSGESDNAIVGGVNLILSPEVSISFTKGRMLSPDGRCKTFDADANGYVRSEGCGMIVLKRLSDAQKNGDNILAVIRGTAINQDGHSNGLTAPNKIAQRQVITDALQNANVTINQVSYIEAHGTGTILGDPIEIDAINEVFKNRRNEYPLTIGSVKSNIGHLESAAGMAGIIKTILMLKNKHITANLHFTKLNPHIRIADTQLQIAVVNKEWKTNDEKRIAGVSSFGFGGVNAHVIIEEYPEKGMPGKELERPFHLLAISAKTENSLLELAKLYQKDITDNKNKPLADICFSAGTGREHFENRISFIGKGSGEILQKINFYIHNHDSHDINKSKVSKKSKFISAMLFTGQGAQYVEMGKLLYETHPLFRELLNICNENLNQYLENPLLEVLFGNDTEKINNTYYTQPALFTLEYALAKLWLSWGIKPDYLLGHSIGEYTAACIADVFTLEDALKLVAARSRLMGSLPAGGAMAVIILDEDHVKDVIEKFGDDVSIAAVNGQLNTVISGEKMYVDQIVNHFAEQGIHSQYLQVSHAFHSSLMEPILDEFKYIAGSIKFNSPKIPIISNITGRIIEDGTIPDAQYWVDHILNTVRFSEGMETLSRLNTDTFIEAGPNPTLIGMGKSCIPGSTSLWLPSIKKGANDWKVILESLTSLYISGADINWNGFDHYYKRRIVQIPNYPFKKERYWVNTSGEHINKVNKEKSTYEKNNLHPLVHSRVHSPLIKEIVFESRLNAKSINLIDDHRIFGKAVMPAAGYAEIILTAIKNTFPKNEFIINSLIITELAVIPDDKECLFQIVLSKEKNSFQIFSASYDSKENTDPMWKLNASGNLIKINSGDNISHKEKFDFENNSFSSDTKVDISEFYTGLNEIGFEHRKTYSILKQIWQNNNEALGYAALVNQTESELYYFHPALIDAGVQLAYAVFSGKNIELDYKEIYLPIGFESFQIFRSKNVNLWINVICNDNESESRDILSCDINWYDDDGNLAACMKGLKYKRTSIETLFKLFYVEPDDWLYEIKWVKQPLVRITNGRVQKHWLIFGDHKGIGDTLAAKLSSKNESCIIVKPGKSFRVIDDKCIEIDPDTPEDYNKLIHEYLSKNNNRIDEIIYLWSIDAVISLDESQSELNSEQTYLCKSILHVIQQIAGNPNINKLHLCLITSASQSVNNDDTIENFYQASLWGFGKVIANEHPELNCTMIDLHGLNIEDDANNLIKETEIGDRESQIAYRYNTRYTARLKRKLMGDTSISAGAEEELTRLEVKEKGTLNGLKNIKTHRIKPKDDEIEIEIKSAGLNFRDVMNVLGLYPGDAGLPGGECAGIISAVGDKVKNLKAGDEVFGIAPGSFANFAITKEELVVHKPECLSFSEASAVPIAFLTAYYALSKLAVISPGDKILIHSASGGVGLAAIQIAQLAGAEIYATAGNKQKQDYLKSLGIKYVMYSRDQSFVNDIMKYTGGKGVDIILNSLNGDYIQNGLSILSTGGTFLEIGKVGIWDEEKVRLFRNDISYFTIAIDEFSQKEPALINSLLQEIKSKFEKGELKPLIYTEYLFEQAEEAFRCMIKAEHIGKIIIIPGNTKNYKNQNNEIRISKNSSYLVTGGLGALGLKTAEWLSSNGAGYIILLGRTHLLQAAEKMIKKIRRQGTAVTIINTDVSNWYEFSTAFKGLENTDNGLLFNNYPLKGIIHAAGIKDDGVILTQTWENFEKVMNPKINGALNIYKYFKNDRLDFIIYYSSAASVLGSPGQANYSAANSFLDSFAYYQSKKGINAISINWAAWKNTGMAKNMKRNTFAEKFGSILPVQGLLILDKILKESIPQICVMPINWNEIKSGLKSEYTPSLLFSEFLTPTFQEDIEQKKEVPINKLLENIPLEERKYKIKEILKKEVLKVLGSNNDVSIETTKPLQELGFDSLLTIELKNEIRSIFGKDLPTALIFDSPSIDKISDYLLKELYGDDEKPAE